MTAIKAMLFGCRVTGGTVTDEVPSEF